MKRQRSLFECLGRGLGNKTTTGSSISSSKRPSTQDDDKLDDEEVPITAAVVDISTDSFDAADDESVSLGHEPDSVFESYESYDDLNTEAGHTSISSTPSTTNPSE